MANDHFTFNGNHSFIDMGILTEIKSLPLFAEPKTIYDDLPGTDGEVNFSQSNPKERLCFKPRIIELECHFADDNENSFGFIQKISALASWLATGEEKILFFDDDLDFYYLAHVANLFNIERITDFSGTFPLVFKCDPFKYRLPGTLFETKGTGTLEVNISNSGYYSPFSMEVYCSASGGFSVYNKRSPDKILTVNYKGDQNTPFKIDTGKMTVSFNGISVIHRCDGDFFELAPGDNTLVFTAPGSQIATDIYFQERFL